GWSGDCAYWAERLPDGQGMLAAGEPPEPGAGRGGECTTPWLYAAYSDRGLDGLSAAFHAYLRARPSHPKPPRPVVLNTWEAVYFDHDLERLTRLAETAAGPRVERRGARED